MDINTDLLHKYLSPQRGIELLKNCQLYLSPVKSYNDPFECLPSTRFLQNPDEAKRILKEIEKDPMSKSLLQEWGIDVTISKVLQLGKVVVWASHPVLAAAIELSGLMNKEKTSKKDDAKETRNFDTYKNSCYPFIKHARVCCFSEEPDNILMWSHYAKDAINSKEHAGIVVSFSKDAQYWSNEMILPVRYHRHRMELPSEASNLDKYIYDILTRKAECWSYEKEWRLISMDEKKTFFSFPPKCIKAIRLGLNISTSNKRDIMRIRDQRYRKVPIYQARRSDYEYEMEFDVL